MSSYASCRKRAAELRDYLKSPSARAMLNMVIEGMKEAEYGVGSRVESLERAIRLLELIPVVESASQQITKVREASKEWYLKMRFPGV